MGDATAKSLAPARRSKSGSGTWAGIPRRTRQFGDGRPWRSVLLHAGVGVLLVPALTWAGDPKRGEPMYQRYCSGCHGADGRGGGKNFMPHVGALNKKGHTELLDDGYVASIITEGGPAYGKSGYMPSFKGTLSPDDIADVIAYVRTFPKY
jgi:mono/diheme cytochrome c family protein